MLRPTAIFPKLLILLVLLGIPSWAWGEEPLPATLVNLDPRGVALGGASRVVPAGIGSVYVNPAALAMTSIYHIGLKYEYTGGDERHSGGVAIVDSVTSIVGAGLSFDYGRIDSSDDELESYDVRLALAGNIADVLFLGLGGRYLRLEHNTGYDPDGPNGQSALPDSGSQQVDGLTLDAGLTLRLAEILHLGVVGNNLTNTGSVFAPLTLTPGVGLALLGMLVVEGDLVLDFTSHEKMSEQIDAGVELLVANVLPLRFGYSYDLWTERHALSGGLGYVDTSFAVDVGFMRELGADPRMRLAFGFKYFAF